MTLTSRYRPTDTYVRQTWRVCHKQTSTFTPLLMAAGNTLLSEGRTSIVFTENDSGLTGK